jgi:Rieske Fe-S protein
MTEPTRRRFLEMVGGAAALAVGGCSAASPGAFGDVAAGTASALPVGTVRPVSGEPVCVARDAKGVYAMTLTCTHQGCDLSQGSVSAEGIRCPCHGSTFDANGDVTRGPATSPLAHFAVSIDPGGNLTIHGGTEVEASTRLAV